MIDLKELRRLVIEMQGDPDDYVHPDTVLKLIEIAEAAKNIDELWFDASKEIGIACHTCDTGGGETFVRPDGHDLKCRIAKVHDALCAAYPKETK